MMTFHLGKTVFAAVCVGLLATGAWAAVITVGPGKDYATIQEAINVAIDGDSIEVAAGEYPGNVTINVPNLTIKGANEGIHAAVGTHPTETVGTRGAESVITGTVAPLAAGIVLDGLKFQHDTDLNITAEAGTTNVDGFIIRNCVFDWTVGDWPTYTTGHLELHGNYNDFLFEFNRLVVDSDSAAMLITTVADATLNGLICQYNYISSFYESIFCTAPLAGAVIKGNEVSGDLGYGGTDFGACTFNIGRAGNIQFVDNEIHDVWHTVAQLGIIDGKIADNTWRDMLPMDDPPDPGEPQYLGSACIMLWGGQSGTAVSKNVQITGNTFMYNNDVELPMAGIRLLRKVPGIAGIQAHRIHINNNYFINLGGHEDSLAVRNDANQTRVLDAELNWWDTIRPGQIDAAIQGAHAVTPYLLAPRGELFVDDSWATRQRGRTLSVDQIIRDSNGDTEETITHTPVFGVTGFATLQEALVAALPGETIYIAEGRYGQTPARSPTGWTLTKSLRLIGPQAGVDPTAPTPGRPVPMRTIGGPAEASLDGPIQVAGDVFGTVIGGLSLVDAPAVRTRQQILTITLGDNAAAVTVYHNFLQDPGADLEATPPTPAWGDAIGLITSSVGLSGLTVYENAFIGYGFAIGLDVAAFDVLIEGNTFAKCKYAVSAMGTTGLAITDNDFEATRGVQLLATTGTPDTPNTDVALTGNSFVGYPADSFEWYVDLPDGGINGTGTLNGRDNSFAGVEVASMTGPQYLALQQNVQDRNDNPSFGLLFLHAVTADDKSADPDETISLTASVTPPAADLSVSFSVDGTAAGSALTDATGVATLSYKAAMGEGTYDIIASHGSSSDTATLTVSGEPGEAVTIVVTGPDGAGNDPVTVAAGSTAAYTAEATDAYGTSWDATAEVAWLTSPGGKGTWAANVYTTQMAGTWNVTATLDTGYGLAQVIVQVGAVDTLSIAPTAVTANIGEVVTFKATATDVFGNKWDASADAVFADAGSAGTFAANVYTVAGPAGPVSITAALGGKTSNTATLTVAGAPAVPAGDPLRYDPDTERFTLGSTPVAADGWYDLGNGTGAEIYIDVTVGVQIKATITQLDLDGNGKGVAALTVGANELKGTPSYRAGNLIKLAQVGTVGSDEYVGNYVRRPVPGATYLAKNGVAAPGSIPELQLLTHTVSLNNTIAQSYGPVPAAPPAP